MTPEEKNQRLSDHLAQFISEHKKTSLEKVLENRTRYITVVLEDIFQSQNASAVVRTCECMGLQDIHVVESKSAYSVNKKVIKGANKWIDLIRYKAKASNNIGDCFKNLKEKGYRILVTEPDAEGSSIDEILVTDQPLAIVMGNELDGASKYALQHADVKVKIPMYGFTESLNISVSAAICLNTLVPKLRQSAVDWQLSLAEKEFIRLQWYRKIVKRSEIIEKEFLRSIE
ncbi:MAG: RNA methyltransferase [Bacteroidia bacterium]|nr:RNA methyltransferase [Bacteroidia bacterium]